MTYEEVQSRIKQWQEETKIKNKHTRAILLEVYIRIHKFHDGNERIPMI